MNDKIIDSRDLAKRLDDLRDDHEHDLLDDDEREELGELESAESEVSEWDDGATLIHEDYFQEYAQELAESLGMISPLPGWPACHIDWKAAADSLKQDYITVELRGSTYYVRG